MGDGPDREVPSVPVSAETILRLTSEEYKRLRAEAGEALDRGDLKSYKDKLTKAALIVAELDGKLGQEGVDSSRLSQNDRSEISYFSTSAKKWVNKGNFFGMSAIFDRKGSKRGDPNDLEKLTERAYPSSKPEPPKA